MHFEAELQGIDIDSGQLAYFYADLGNMHAGMPLGFLLHALQYRGCNSQIVHEAVYPVCESLFRTPRSHDSIPCPLLDTFATPIT